MAQLLSSRRPILEISGRYLDPGRLERLADDLLHSQASVLGGFNERFNSRRANPEIECGGRI